MKQEMIRLVTSLIASMYPGFYIRTTWLTPNDVAIRRVRWIFLTDVVTFLILMGAFLVLLIWSAFDPV